MATPNLVDLDFKDIRNQLKTYMQNQSEFTDYDFEGSGLSVLLDVLAYNTHMNALMAHLSLNESFLNTAQVRANVVSHAQLLGYVPRSKSSPSVNLDVTVTGSAGSPPTITIPTGYSFTGKINNVTYSFSVLNSVTASKSQSNIYTFTNLPVYEGTIKTERFNVDGLIEFQKHEINSKNIDTSTLEVKVYDTPNSQLADTYAPYSTIAESGPNSLVYFLQENVFGNYDVYFGDGLIGKKPENGSVVEVKYIETKGEDANNITSLSAGADIDGLSSITVAFSAGYAITSGGSDAENIEAIRYNAPLINATQDRAVTSNDYATLILDQFSQLSDVSVWGGEQAEPPVYGKVFITPALKSEAQLSQSFKESIKSFLRTKNLGSILPEIVDPEYTYIQLFVGVKYDINSTTQTVGQLETLVRNEIDAYGTDVLNRFAGVLRQSQLLTRLDRLDDGIVNTVIRPTLYKKFDTDPTNNVTYELQFPSTIRISTSEDFSIDSSIFEVDGIKVKVGDKEIVGSTTQRTLFFYSTTTGVPLSNYSDVGTVDKDTGKVILNAIQFDNAEEITIYVTPDAFDVAPKYNQLLKILSSDVTVNMSADLINSNGLSAVADYETFTKY